jgi:hypothetical protein
MINLFTTLFLLFFHWFADFICQTDKQAKNKSTSNKALLSHTLTYSGVIFIAMQLLYSFNYFGAQTWYARILFVGIQFITHTIIDYFTSRINSKLWTNGDTHNFFVSIGFDQFMHMAIMFTSFNIIYN